MSSLFVKLLREEKAQNEIDKSTKVFNIFDGTWKDVEPLLNKFFEHGVLVNEYNRVMSNKANVLNYNSNAYPEINAYLSNKELCSDSKDTMADASAKAEEIINEFKIFFKLMFFKIDSEQIAEKNTSLILSKKVGKYKVTVTLDVNIPNDASFINYELRIHSSYILKSE